jgi:hypothetical protein
MILDYLCLAQFIANYDTKTCKICKCVIFWACFNVLTNLENHYKELLLLFYPFCESKINLKKSHYEFLKISMYIISILIKIMMNKIIYNPK